MRKVKKCTIFCVIIMLFSVIGTSITGFAAFSPSFKTYSDGIYMVNLDTDIVVMSKNADKKLYPASTTKIMTCLVSLMNIKDFNAKVECPYECFDEFNGDNPNYIGPSTGAIEPLQDNLTYNDCLYAMMLASACEASNILAYNVAGSVEKFVDMMNETAKKIGCKNTHFANTHGLFDEENYTTAYDMYLITKYAMDNYPGFMKICGTYEYDMPANDNNPEGYTLTHTNYMMCSTSSYYYEGVSGVKTGSIDRYYYKKNGEWDWDNYDYGSRALVTTAEQNGYKYLLVTLGAPYCNSDGSDTDTLLSFTDHINLYDWAFREFEYTQVIEKNQQVMQADVTFGKDTDKVGIVTTEDYFTLMPKSIDKTSVQQIKPTVQPMDAPVTKGTKVGDLELRLNGETLTTIPLVTESDVELDTWAQTKSKIESVLKSPQFIVSVIVLVALVITWIIAFNINRRRKLMKSDMQRRRKIKMAPSNKNNYRNNRRR